jgi:TonB-dependent starch-binding outer membrane protein SusC
MFNTLINFLMFYTKNKLDNRLVRAQFKSPVLIIIILFWSNILVAQTVTIKGTVTTDDIQGPLPGVSVQEKGTNNGTTTDFDGNYTLTVSKPTATLIFSYIGYQTKEVALNGKTTVNIVLTGSTDALDEVVLVGYGSARRSDLTGSVVTIGGEDLKKQAIANVAETLTGRLAGVQVTSSEGSPDAEINIRVRGGGSLTQDASPLIIVDGFPVNSINDISPTDIETITVLKDASSTAIYGARGANGVILVTTKSGKEGKLTINYNMFYGFKQIANTIDVLEPEDFVNWQYEYALLRNNIDSYERFFGVYEDIDQYTGMRGNNWQRQIYGRTGEVQSRDLSVRGGTDKINYNFNYALFDEKTIMVGSDFKRTNISFALKSKVSEKIDLAFTFRYADTKINGGGANEQNEVSSSDARLRHSVGYSPIPIPGLTETDTDEALSSYLVNPFVAVDDNQRRQLRTNFNMLGSFSWKIIDNLQFRSEVGLDNRNDLDYRFYGRSTFYANNRPSANNQGLPALIFRDRKLESFRNANTFNYDFKNILGDNHGLKLLVGQESIIIKNNQLTNEIQGFPRDFDFDTSIKLTTQGLPLSVDNFYSPDDKLLSFFGRANYDFKNKYLFTATYRIDGSSKFLGDNRWGFFPSAAVAWKMKEENFLQNADWLSALKLRISYGEAGNNNIPTGQTVQNFQSSITTFLNDVDTIWAASNILANPDLKWETTISQNLGIDFGIFNNRITGSIEAYKGITKDLLIRFPVPGTGYDSQFRNMGEIQNTGIEASINFVAIDQPDYGLNLSFNIGANRNRVNSLGLLDNFGINTNWASTQIGIDYFVEVGQPIGLMYGYRSDGRYEVSDFNFDPTTNTYTLRDGVADASAVIGNVRPGAMKLIDINGDGIVDINDNTIIGNAQPKHTGGMVLNAFAYGFDLTAAFNWSVGNDIYNANKIEFNTSNLNGQYRNLTTMMSEGNRWTNLNPATGQLVTDPAQLEALNANTTMWSPFMERFVFSDWAVEDGSFLRLNTLSLGYTIPDSLLTKSGISNLRFYLTANNVFVLTNYSGLDPEVSTRRRTPLTPGVDYSPFPRSRQLIFGLNLSF